MRGEIEMAEYEMSLKRQPLYCSAFFATKAAKELYLQAPAWVKAWMDALDEIYAVSLSPAA